MRELSIEKMEMVSGGKISWKCVLGIVAVCTGAVLAATGVGAGAAGGAISGGISAIVTQC
ncbi:hypothetical protein MM236_16285 [Belliella sp. DSM 107340]|uniref:Bacteriocin class II with double-glycine leader peptide n=1 Tax=Belliella calami TaxID=2923436 RepID=A0ABS9UTH3_9BACT|nr:hypothetical protein [Belliella calami]MCH7399563.1 hypothetical protein [Belliella calami]